MGTDREKEESKTYVVNNMYHNICCEQHVSEERTSDSQKSFFKGGDQERGVKTQYTRKTYVGVRGYSREVL